MRWVAVGGLLLAVGLSHWLTPVDQPILHGIHVVMRKMLMVPVVLSAMWWGIRGAWGAASCATLIYLPHVIMQWNNQPIENLNQVSELISLWGIALLVGYFIDHRQRTTQALADSHKATIFSLVRALDAREHATEQHSLRVAAVSTEIGKRLGLGHADLDALNSGALLHDVGKIGVPDAILLKPGPLTDDEWRIMRQHPDVGRGILSSVPRLDHALDVIYSHHERFDGTGYPRGLAGEAIPLFARIFAIADALDAMASRRPYKDPMPLDQARHRIADDANTHFDPRIVDAFLSIPLEHLQGLLDEVGSSPADDIEMIAVGDPV